MFKFLVFVTINCPVEVFLVGFFVGYIFIPDEILLIFGEFL